MNTKALNSLADLICRAQEQDRTPMGIAFAIDSAGRHMSPETAAELERLRARVAELEAQRDRRRARLVALQNDALSMRGSLAPNGEDRKVPFALGETLTPAVDWLIARVAELEAERHTTNEALDDAVQALRKREQSDAIVAKFVAARAEYITSIRNCHPDNGHDYDRWQGHAAARRQLSELLGLPVAWPVDEDVSSQVQKLRGLLAGQRAAVEDPHDGPLHHTYRVGRDLPETGGVSC